MKNNKKILILADTDLTQDGRIRRHLFALKDLYNITITGIKTPQIEGASFIDCSKLPITQEELLYKRRVLRERLAKKEFEDVYWGENYIINLYNQLMLEDIDLIIANDISMVPLGVKIAEEKRIPIIADMHEYAPKEFEESLEWMEMFFEYRQYLCETYLPRCNHIFTVSKGIAQEYKKEFGVECELLTNAPKYQEIVPSRNNDKVRLVYHGGCNTARKLGKIIDIMQLLGDKYELDMYLIGNQQDINIQALIHRALNTRNVFIKEPVKPEEIVKTINRYDLGIYPLEAEYFNHKYALPNKFFEFIQARLGIVIGPDCEMSEYVSKFECGIIAGDFNAETIAEEIKTLKIDKIKQFKLNADKLARIENAEKNTYILQKIVYDTLSF